MGNINYFGKSFKGSLFGGDKSDRGDRGMSKSERDKKA